MKKLKILKKTYKNEPLQVHDIEVKDAHHYFLKNGILSHNSVGSFIPQDVMSGGGGPLYNASFIAMLYKSQLKEKSNDENPDVDMKATGIVVRSKVKKGRFARPIQIRFHISFFKGMNPYVGLEEFINWKTCGIEKGNIFDEKSHAKWTQDEKDLAEKNGWGFEHDGKKLWIWPKATSRNFVVRHLGTTIPPGELFSPKVLTEEVLHELDENIIKPTFLLPSVTDIYDVEDFIDTLIPGTEDEEEL